MNHELEPRSPAEIVATAMFDCSESIPHPRAVQEAISGQLGELSITIHLAFMKQSLEEHARLNGTSLTQNDRPFTPPPYTPYDNTADIDFA